MEKGVRMQVTLAPQIAEKLDSFCKEKGVKRAAVISLALTEFLEGGKGGEK